MHPVQFLRRRRALIVLPLLVLSAALLRAGEPPEIPLWPGIAPGSEGKTGPEHIEKSPGGERKISNIHTPSLTPFLPPADKALGAAVIIAPGGAHKFLCVDHEGYNVARWLAERGIAAFVLKNRLAKDTNSTYRIEVEALADTQRAIRLVRSRAAEWHVNPRRVGVMGFSAGGELAALASMKFDAGQPDAADPVARPGSKPDFQALIYPGRSATILPAPDAPPAFLACGFNDRQDIAEGLAEVYLRFKKAGVPADLHIYSGAGHGFGVRDGTKGSAGTWLARFEDFLGDRGFLKRD